MIVEAKILSSQSNLPTNKVKKQRGILWEARNRIFASYGILMTGFIGLSVPIIAELVDLLQKFFMV